MPVDYQNRNPSQRLESVIRTSHNAKPETPRNAALSAARSTKRAQRQVGGKIGQLAENVQRDRGVGQEGVWVGFRGRGGGRVGEVSDQHAGEEPIVGRVFEDVEEGHGGEGEAVDEEGFQLALEEVQDYHGEGEGLQGGRAGVEGWQGVDVGSQVVD